MTDFVLVAGARLGAWAWEDVAPLLRAAGHGAHALTLSGLAEREDAAATGQRAHVRDIVAEVERRDLGDVVLVGHSYAGIPVGQAAGRIGGRLRRLVLVDASVPAEGVSFADSWPDGGAGLRATLAAHGGWWPPGGAEHFAGHGLTEEQIARILAGATAHPGPSLTEPAVLARPLAELPGTYVLCRLAGPEPEEDVTALLDDARGNWELVGMDTGHWPMFSRPRELARLLLAAAR
ncbi:alpha/beta fold hydrolase [Streptomyces sp. NPDC088923]|uniref:alpha/beta fold hydrolase n=1 Tax=Streptomyces sp. NPDC088923 TaxID=3365913 RepID=UPI003802F9C1